jgi:hypothetical protein
MIVLIASLLLAKRPSATQLSMPLTSTFGNLTCTCVVTISVNIDVYMSVKVFDEVGPEGTSPSKELSSVSFSGAIDNLILSSVSNISK